MPTLVLHPSLQAALAASGVDPDHVDIGLPMEPESGPNRPSRSEIFLIGSANQFGSWQVESLSSLFRGTVSPPEMKDYPVEYIPVFACIEQHVLLMAGARTPTDGEMEEIYSNLRRRPDGRSMNPTHDVVWQIAAYTLGRYPLSAAEFDAIFTRLVKSVRSWKLGPSTREYLGGLRQMFTKR